MKPIKIKACEFWNNTEFKVEKGKTYKLNADGKWKDCFTIRDADGWSFLNLFRIFSRFPEARMFQLVGCINCDENTFFVIGKNRTYKAKKTGILYCFANDWKKRYGNNSGSIKLTIKEIESETPIVNPKS